MIAQEIKRADKPVSAKNETPTSFNLKNIFDKVEEEKPVIESRENLPKNTFTEEILLKAWGEFVENLKAQNKIPAYNALHTAKVSLGEDFVIIFEFSSLTLSSEFDLQKDLLMRELREKLQNDFIVFEVKIHSQPTQSYIKTKAEIFKEMAEKNPILLKMKNEFGLDLNSND